MELELKPEARPALSVDCETLAHMPLATLLYHVLTQSFAFTPNPPGTPYSTQTS